MSGKNIYSSMYKPIKVGDVLLKSRFYASQSKPHSLQGPETFPAEGMFRHYINKAKQGAAYVTMSGGMVLDPPARTRGLHKNTMFGHFPGIDVKDSTVQNYLCQLADALHFYGAKACMMVGRNSLPEMGNVDVDNDIPPFVVLGDGGGAGFVNDPGRRITKEEMEAIADDVALDCEILKECGFDMVYMHAAYRLMLPGRFLSKRTNTRDDEFGGCMENRCKFLFMVCDRIKERCGKGFPIEVAFTGLDLDDPDPAKHWTLEDTREFVNLAKGHIDILQVRTKNVEYQHNMGFEPPLPTLEACKVAHEAANGEILISAITGYNHPSMIEAAVGEGGHADLVGLSRLYISNPEWQDMCDEGRTDDIAPCIKCSKCHRNTYRESHQAVCSVNPLYGIEHRIDYLKKPVKKIKNIAIVGGGPAGMRAAMFATENGHKVSLFEKTDRLGGLLNINDDVDFKWPIKDYNHWLIRKTLENPNVVVHLNAEATKETLKLGNYDEIFVAIGGEKIVPNIPGINQENVMWATDVYGNAEKVGEKVVIIGGGDVGVETGFYLTRKGKKVFVIEMQEELMLDATPIHYRARFVDEWNKDENFSFVCNAVCTEIGKGTVTYKNADNVEIQIPADTVIYSVGMRHCQEKALKFYDAGEKIHLIGDCNKPGSVQSCNKDAYYTVNSL